MRYDRNYSLSFWLFFYFMFYLVIHIYLIFLVFLFSVCFIWFSFDIFQFDLHKNNMVIYLCCLDSFFVYLI